MNDIQVAYQGVKVAVDDLDALAGTLTSAQTLVDTYFRVEPGGRFLDDARASVDRIRGQLGTQYAGLSTKVAGASDTIADIWKDFERTDGQARVDFEERRARLAQHPGSGFPGLGGGGYGPGFGGRSRGRGRGVAVGGGGGVVGLILLVVVLALQSGGSSGGSGDFLTEGGGGRSGGGGGYGGGRSGGGGDYGGGGGRY